jgi:hypothetical protein
MIPNQNRILFAAKYKIKLNEKKNVKVSQITLTYGTNKN